MTQDNLHHLIEKYREGTLTDAELAELNRLSHKDEVLASANRRAGVILFRRYAGRTGIAMAALLLLGAGIWFLRPHHDDKPLVAEAQPVAAMPTAEAQPAPLEASTATLGSSQAPARAANATHKHTPAPKQAHKATSAKLAASPIVVSKQLQLIEDQPVESVVICNNQCEADSVISDIWKFLSA